ncbi:MAG: TIM barrel protein [Pseudomonadota bacterium]
MPRFSANLGFLWQDLPLADAIRAAHSAGFDAVECHWPYDEPLDAVKTALSGTALPMLGLNTRRGDTTAGENGLAAVPGRTDDARAAIDEAIDYGAEIGAGAVHVMAGFATGPEAERTFRANLEHACTRATDHSMTILIEPLNHYDAPGYFLSTTGHAERIISDVGAPNLKLMFDCYHVQLMEGDISRRLARLLPVIGHIQLASVPDRGPPGQGELNYAHIFAEIDRLGYTAPLGAEYKPGGPTEATLKWLESARQPV